MKSFHRRLPLFHLRTPTFESSMPDFGARKKTFDPRTKTLRRCIILVHTRTQNFGRPNKTFGSCKGFVRLIEAETCTARSPGSAIPGFPFIAPTR